MGVGRGANWGGKGLEWERMVTFDLLFRLELHDGDDDDGEDDERAHHYHQHH